MQYSWGVVYEFFIYSLRDVVARNRFFDHRIGAEVCLRVEVFAFCVTSLEDGGKDGSRKYDFMGLLVWFYEL